MDVEVLLDPEVAALLATLPAAAPLTLDGLPQVRAASAAAAAQYTPTVAVTRTDHTLTSYDGHRFVVRVHRSVTADESQPAPMLLWMHGGGLVSGTHLSDDERFDDWCLRFGVIGVAVDYGLAPERPYPGGLEDCYAALRWLTDGADELRVRPSQIGIGGASAGGNIAAALALLARDRGEFHVDFQALVYPMLDDRMTTASSGWEVPIWPPASNAFAWSAYLSGLRRGDDDVPAYAAPARAHDLSGLPSTFICVGALDGFVDEDMDYASRLMRAGVPVELHVYPGAPHAFDLVVSGSHVAHRSREHLREWLGAQLERGRVQSLPGTAGGSGATPVASATPDDAPGLRAKRRRHVPPTCLISATLQSLQSFA